LRGNVDTRIRKLQSGEFEAIILAAAGLNRLGQQALIRERLPVEAICPAAGQGALAIEVRSEDKETISRISFMDDHAGRVTTSCERALLNGLGGGCQVPIGAHATLAGKQITLIAVVAAPDGSTVLRERESGTDPLKLGEAVAKRLLGAGAQKILDQIYGAKAAAPEQP
jgi:hydroxymethylbilane synthase